MLNKLTHRNNLCILLDCIYIIWKWKYFLFPTVLRPKPRSSFTRFLDHTQRRTTVGRNPLDERPLPDNTQHSQLTDIHASGGIRTYNLSRQAAANLRLRTRGNWDQRGRNLVSCILNFLTWWRCDQPHAWTLILEKATLDTHRWAPELVWTLWKRKVLCRESNKEL